MIDLDTVIVALIVLGSAAMTVRWIWRGLHPPAEGGCSGCSSAGGACGVCSLSPPDGDSPSA